jgi:hypothetical protein
MDSLSPKNNLALSPVSDWECVVSKTDNESLPASYAPDLVIQPRWEELTNSSFSRIYDQQILDFDSTPKLESELNLPENSHIVP